MTVDMRAVCPREPIENLGARLHSWSAVACTYPVWRIHGGACGPAHRFELEGALTVASFDLEQFDAAVDE